MATLIDNPSFTANEIYEIMATDPVEGAASGASFGGIGIDNQPHQQLADRTSFLYERQNTNIANISALQAFQGVVTGLLAQNGYMKLGVADVDRGLIQYIIQWGYVNFGGIQTQGIFGPYNYPIAFPNACEILLPVVVTANGPGFNTDDDAMQISNGYGGIYLPTATQFYVYNNRPGQSATDGSRGFMWLAIGF
jgi:hypothetical protein